MLVPILTWLVANPIATTVIFISGVMLVKWFIATYWLILVAVLLLWAIPKVLEILRGFGIDFRKTEDFRQTERLIQWMDGKEKKDENTLMAALNLFKQKIRRIGSTYVKKNADTVVKKHEMLVDLGNDQGALVTQEESIRWDDVPSEIRAELIRHRLDSFTVNDFEVFDQRVKQRAEEEKMPQLMEMVC